MHPDTATSACRISIWKFFAHIHNEHKWLHPTPQLNAHTFRETVNAQNVDTVHGVLGTETRLVTSPVLADVVVEQYRKQVTVTNAVTSNRSFLINWRTIVTN